MKNPSDFTDPPPYAALDRADQRLRQAGEDEEADDLRDYVEALVVQLRDAEARLGRFYARDAKEVPSAPLDVLAHRYGRQEAPAGRQHDRRGRFAPSPRPVVAAAPAPPLMGPVAFECKPLATWRIEHAGRGVDLSCRHRDGGLVTQVMPMLAVMARNGGETFHRFGPELGHDLATAINWFLKRRVRPHWPALADALHVGYRKRGGKVRFKRWPLAERITLHQPGPGDVVIVP